MERKVLRGQQDFNKKKDPKMFIAKFYKVLLFILFFFLGVLFPTVSVFQYIVTGLVVVFLSQLIAKFIGYIDKAFLKWASPVKVTHQTFNVEDLDQVIDSPEKLVEMAKYISSLKSEEEFFSNNNESEVSSK